MTYLMNTKTRIISIAAAIVAAGAFTACSDWVTPEARDLRQYPDDSYYEALRAYKASDHSIAFGWLGGWNPTAATTFASLSGVPDSVDMVAIWSPFTPDEAQKAEMRSVREKKGTKVVVTTLLTNIGLNATPDEVTADAESDDEIVRLRRLYWGWTDDATPEEIETALRKYANALVDIVLENGYDGLDIDFEPSYWDHYGNIVSTIKEIPEQGDIYAGTTPAQRVNWFVDECSKRLGPKSTSGKMLIVDGEVALMPKETIDCFDYFILQTYTCTRQASLDSRLNGLVTAFGDVLDEELITKKTIVTENFENTSYASQGGVPMTLKDGTTTNSLYGMAIWEPDNGYRKGGFGAYYMQNDFRNDCYSYYRRAITAMNRLGQEKE